MTDKELFKAIGAIDDRFIEEAACSASAAPKLRRRIAARVAVLTASLVAVVGITAALGIPERNSAAPTENLPVASEDQIMENDAAAPGKAIQQDLSIPDSLKNSSEYSVPSRWIKSGAKQEDKETKSLSSFHEDERLIMMTQTDPVRELWHLTVKRSTDK